MQLEMEEEMLKSNLLDYFEAKYTSNDVNNLVKNSFILTAEGSVKWIQEPDFTFKSFAIKSLCYFNSSLFKKQANNNYIVLKAT